MQQVTVSDDYVLQSFSGMHGLNSSVVVVIGISRLSLAAAAP